MTFILVDHFAGEIEVEGKESANRIPRRQMIFVRFVIIDAIVFEGSRQPPGRRLPGWSLHDKFVRCYDAHQIASQLFRALSLNMQACARGGAPAYSAKQRPQRIGLAAGNMSQFMG